MIGPSGGKIVLIKSLVENLPEKLSPEAFGRR
jgi:hypothetical protein